MHLDRIDKFLAAYEARIPDTIAEYFRDAAGKVDTSAFPETGFFDNELARIADSVKRWSEQKQQLLPHVGREKLEEEANKMLPLFISLYLQLAIPRGAAEVTRKGHLREEESVARPIAQGIYAGIEQKDPLTFATEIRRSGGVHEGFVDHLRGMFIQDISSGVTAEGSRDCGMSALRGIAIVKEKEVADIAASFAPMIAEARIYYERQGYEKAKSLDDAASQLGLKWTGKAYEKSV